MLAELVNHLWQSTLFGLAAAVIAMVLRRDGASVRYWIWWAASVKFLVPFAWLVALGGVLAPNVPAVAVLAAWPEYVEKLAEPLGAEASWTPALVALAAIWAGGFAAVIGVWGARALQIRAVAAAAVPCSDLPIGGRAPLVKYSKSRLEPAVVGVFRPVLLLPHGIDKRLTRRQLEAVLEHELCHWRRHDNLTAAVHMLVAALFWFHPLVWWIGRRLWAEREQACDEAVIAAGHDRAVYAAAILDVCELYLASPLQCAPGIGGADLKQRITTIVVSAAPTKRLHAAKKAVLTAAAALALAVPVAAGALVGSSAFALEGTAVIPTYTVAPVYPEQAFAEQAFAAGLDGVVTLDFAVTKDGSTADVTAVASTSPVFEQAAVDALRQWRYAPVIVNDRPVAVRGVRTVIRFQIVRYGREE